MSEASCEDLLGRYRKKRTARTRDLLVERHRPAVEAMARALAMRLPRSVDIHDLTHAGVWGLLQAIEKFRADRGVPFAPFMRPRVRGAMIDELRNMDFLPRLYRQRLRARDAAAGALRSRLARDPSDSELAAELGVSEERLRSAYAPMPAAQRLPDSTDRREGLGMSDLSLVESIPDERESPLEAFDRQDLIEKIESSLQPIEWMVLRMHYLEGKSGKDVARELRLSAARICQIHVRVLSRLKSRLGSLV